MAPPLRHWYPIQTFMQGFDEILRVISSLNQVGVDYVIVGGVALNFHGLARGQITADDLCGDYPAVRYGPPHGTLYLDILTRLGEATRYADLETEVVEVDGVRARIATARTLYRMKKDTVRPIDKADAEALRQAFNLGDESGG